MPRSAVRRRDRYEFFAGLEGDDPIWSGDTDDRAPVFSDPKGTERVAMTYDPGIDRYLLTTSHEVAGQEGAHGPGFGLFVAPDPWGP